MGIQLSKVSEAAATFKVSEDAVRLWIRTGVIPSDCVVRLGRTVRLDSQRLEQLARSGRGLRPPRRASAVVPVAAEAAL